jgi:hypothetical protein
LRGGGLAVRPQRVAVDDEAGGTDALEELLLLCSDLGQ